MRRKSFKNKVRNNVIGDFVIEYYRYILAVILLIVLIVVVKACTGGKDKEEKPVVDTEMIESSSEEVDFNVEFDHDANPAIKNLLSTYYNAFANGDVATISSVATPVSENEKNYIGVISEYYEDIQNITYYSKNGQDDGTFFVSTKYDIKFVDIETLAPAMDFFYIETGSDGELVINNLYSIYNLTFAENSMDSDIYSLIQLYMQQNDFINLKRTVEAEYAEAIVADISLEKMLKETLDSAIREWALTIVPSDDSEDFSEEIEDTEFEDIEPEEGEDGDEPEGDIDEPAPEPEQEPAPEPEIDTSSAERVATTDGVNIRKTASTSGEVLEKVKAGTILNKIGTEGEWTIVEHNGHKGYVKTEFIGKVPQVIAIDGVNIRKSPSTDAEALGKAAKGTVLDKLGETEEWTIVSYKGQKGYVKTEFVSNR